MKKLCLVFLIFFIATKSFSQSHIYIIPTIHELHKINRHYNYDSLKSNIERLKPDILAVEIRPEDIKEDSSYLNKNYPDEMWMALYWFPKIIIGYDWLSDDIEGKPIPDNYWQQQSNIKQWISALNADTAFKKITLRCDIYQNARLQILEKSTLKEILYGFDAMLTRQYYDCLGTSLQMSPYYRISEYYLQHNLMMTNRIIKIIKNNPGRRIVILTGDEHYPYIKDMLQKENITTDKIY